MLNKSVSSLISYLHDPNQNDSVLNILVEVSLSQPAAVASFLPNLKAVGEDLPNLLGQIAKIYGAVGHFDEVGVNLFNSMFAQKVHAQHLFNGS